MKTSDKNDIRTMNMMEMCMCMCCCMGTCFDVRMPNCSPSGIEIL